MDKNCLDMKIDAHALCCTAAVAIVEFFFEQRGSKLHCMAASGGRNEKARVERRAFIAFVFYYCLQ
ncbi:MAG: hypothetical protein K2Y28_03995 [Burkholderiaceae bacterium]|nr:hypothetical protein [Burkholderiaceae bacterium]